MKRIKKWGMLLFLKLYKISPLSVQRLIFFWLRKNFPQHKLVKKIPFKGSFEVYISRNTKFKIVNYGGLIEERTLRHGLFKNWESESGHIWKQLCVFSNIIFDVGANTGIYSLVAKAIHNNSKVYAFEPSPRNFAKLKKNNEINNFDIQCEPFAISNITEVKRFFDLPSENQTTSSLLPDVILNRKNYSGDIVEYPVKAITLSDYIQENEIKNIDLIKIDIELHEAEAIEGFGKLLYQFQPIILLEVLTSEVAHKLNKLLDFEQFQLFHLRKEGVARQLSKFEITSDSIENWEWNFLLFHKSQKEKIKKHTDLFVSE